MHELILILFILLLLCNVMWPIYSQYTVTWYCLTEASFGGWQVLVLCWGWIYFTDVCLKTKWPVTTNELLHKDRHLWFAYQITFLVAKYPIIFGIPFMSSFNILWVTRQNVKVWKASYEIRYKNVLSFLTLL